MGPGVWFSAVSVKRSRVRRLAEEGNAAARRLLPDMMVPKSLALQYAERTALAVVWPVEATRFVLYPLVVGLDAAGNGLLRLFGIRRDAGGHERFCTSDELELIVEESTRDGLLRSGSGRMVRELFECGETTAGEAMVPRVQVTGIRTGAAPEEIAEIVGDIAEGPETAPRIERLGGGRLRAAGTVRLDRLGEELGLEFEHEEVHTLSGLVLDELGCPPRIGDRVVFDGVEVEVVAVAGRGVGRAEVGPAAGTAAPPKSG